MFYLLHGPPGSGKSTIIELAKKHHIKAVDLEHHGSGESGEENRLKAARDLVQTTNRNEHTLVGMADVDIDEFPKKSIKIMLLPSREVYIRRKSARDAREPLKRDQDPNNAFYDRCSEHNKRFDRVIQNDGSPEETLEEIVRIARGNL